MLQGGHVGKVDASSRQLGVGHGDEVDRCAIEITPVSLLGMAGIRLRPQHRLKVKLLKGFSFSILLLWLLDFVEIEKWGAAKVVLEVSD